MDVGTGGGFPGIPLAILFPHSEFTLVDSIGKKIKVVKAVQEALGLKNVRAFQTRVEQMNESFDFVISRAVTRLPDFMDWMPNKIRKKGINDLPNGVLYLKGGDLEQELASLKRAYKLFPLSDYYTEEFFDTKFLVHIRK